MTFYPQWTLRPDQAPAHIRLALRGHTLWGQSARIAQILNQDLGIATITHPYHPLHGKTFTILKIRKLASGRRYSLLSDEDVFCVPESWITPEEANCSGGSPFNAEVLRLLLDLSRIHEKNVDKAD